MRLNEYGTVLGLTLIVVGSVKCVVGCAGAKTVGDVWFEGAAASVYLAEQLACIDESETKNAAQACINSVRARWAADAGGDAR